MTLAELPGVTVSPDAVRVLVGVTESEALEAWLGVDEATSDHRIMKAVRERYEALSAGHAWTERTILLSRPQPMETRLDPEDRKALEGAAVTANSRPDDLPATAGESLRNSRGNLYEGGRGDGTPQAGSAPAKKKRAAGASEGAKAQLRTQRPGTRSSGLSPFVQEPQPVASGPSSPFAPQPNRRKAMPKKITPEELRSHEEVFERVKQERLKHGYRVRQVAEAAGLTEGAFFQAKYKGFSRAAMEKLGVFFGWVAPEKSAPSAPSPSLKDIPDEALKAKGITRKPVAPPAPAAVNQADQLQLATCRLSAASGAFFRARDEFFAALDEVNRLAAKL